MKKISREATQRRGGLEDVACNLRSDVGKNLATEFTELRKMVNKMFHSTKNKINEFEFVFVSENISPLLVRVKISASGNSPFPKKTLRLCVAAREPFKQTC